MIRGEDCVNRGPVRSRPALLHGGITKRGLEGFLDGGLGGCGSFHIGGTGLLSESTGRVASEQSAGKGGYKERRGRGRGGRGRAGAGAGGGGCGGGAGGGK
ncbi:rRNA 2'-O-methyltransferase fibrillarin-like [Vespa mandarinia]|uniref:rRNA 2'-O-methyltransferase fibrillarin-like n=1 Tax=Vespa mandarinia TaxID=7446 RepID=UPI00161902EF|nr:rRNA 2'-O-methyltransferase fibrillarin-like [Vespa mandarinia]